MTTFLKKSYLWVQESTLRTAMGLMVLSLLVGGVSYLGLRTTKAANSYLVSDEAQMNLDVSITSTQTTGIILASPQVNGSNFTFTTTTGGVLRIRSGVFREDIFYSLASVSSSTNKVTLSGVIRGLCPQVTQAYVDCGLGRNWGKGAIVELTVDARILNLSAKIDRQNVFSGSGQVTGNSTTQATFRVNSVTTAQRDAFTNTANGDVIYNTTAGCAQYRSAGAWYCFGSGATLTTASLTQAGKVQLASTGAMLLQTATGSTQANNVLWAKYTTASGGLAGIRKIGYAAVTDSTGFLSGSLLGNGAAGGNKYLRNDHTWQTVVSASGVNLQSNIVDASNYTTTSTTFVDIDSALTTTVNASVGDLLMIILRGNTSHSLQNNNTYFDIRVNGGRIGKLDGGAAGLSKGLFDITSDVGANIPITLDTTIFHRALTGGTLTIRPQWRTVSGTATLRGSSDAATYLQVVVVH